ncbi:MULTISPECIES: DUF1254 domain-containing protein [Sphingomonas]|uniref:DUF1254 domain-containing protein n=1 Tax=Sphingomonas TaxID=13687 RepID=UPI00082E67A4|nr:DUF1254 domain-containing protein [Sphingomonas sp. CCH10-B3]
MIRRWLGALMFGLLCGLIAWLVTLALIPHALMSFAVSRVAQQAGAINAFAHAPLVTAASRAIVRPSPDLLYSSCPFDVSDAPLLIDATPVDAPYWSLSIFDSQTNAVFVRNNQAGLAPVKVAVLGPGQSAPAGYTAVNVKGARGLALVRILIDRRHPSAAIDAARRTARCRLANERGGA